MKVRLQADADFNEIIVRAVLCREPALDFRTAPAVHLAGLDDPAILKLAAEAGLPLRAADFDPGALCNREPAARSLSVNTPLRTLH